MFEWSNGKSDKYASWCLANDAANRKAIEVFAEHELARIGDRPVPTHAYRTRDLLQTAVMRIGQHLPEHTCRVADDGKGGAWALRFDAVSGSLLDHFADDPEGKTSSVNGPDGPGPNYVAFHVSIATSLVFFAARGNGEERATARDAIAPLRIGARDVGDLLEFAAVTDLAIGDIDADGTPEAVVVRETGSQELYEGLPDVTQSSAVYTAVPDARPFDGIPADVLVLDLADRALVVRGPYLGKLPTGIADEDMYGPSLVLRSMSNGTFEQMVP